MAHRKMAVTSQHNIDVAACIDDGSFAAQLHDFAEDAHDTVLELGEVRGQDAGSLGVVHGVDWGNGL